MGLKWWQKLKIIFKPVADETQVRIEKNRVSVIADIAEAFDLDKDKRFTLKDMFIFIRRLLDVNEDDHVDIWELFGGWLALRDCIKKVKNAKGIK